MNFKTLKTGLDTTGGTPIWWCGGSKRRVYSRTVNEGGIRATEQLPNGPYRAFVTPAGHVINMSLTSGASNLQVNAAEAQGRVQRKLRAGFLPYEECPMATQRMPSDLIERKGGRVSDSPCKEWIDESGFSKPRSRHDCCPHLQRVIDYRRARHEELGEKHAERFKTNPEKMLEVLMQRELRDAAGTEKP